MSLSAALCVMALTLPNATSLSSLFSETSKDFGDVPHGSVTPYQFVLKNTTGSVIRLSSVRTSCKCAQPTAVKSVATPGEEIVIEVKFDARLFVGARSMTITATFDQPHFESVALRVNGVSRQDVVIEPGVIDLGAVARGDQSRRQVRIEYAGGADWAIHQVLAGDGVIAAIENEDRRPGRVEYRLSVALEPDVPAGDVNSYVQIQTTDSRVPVLTVPISGTVQAALAASPDNLRLGTLRQGETVQKRIVVRGSQPFSIQSVGGAPANVRVSATEGDRTVHLVQIDIQAETPGQLDVTIMLNTSLANDRSLPIQIAALVE